MPRLAPARPERIAVLIFEGVAVFEMAVPCEVWGIDRTAEGVPAAEVRVCTSDPVPLRTNMGFSVDTVHGLETLAWADIVIIPGFAKPPSKRLADEQLKIALWAAWHRGATIASLCSGAYLLAQAGLLDDRQATTHWMFAEDFHTRYPQIDLDTSVLYVGDGQVFTSAGTAAGIDLCLHLVRTRHGAEVANTIARRMIVPPHRDGGQAQYVETPVPASPDVDDDLRATLDWAAQHLDAEITVEILARRAAMTERTFARRFKAATGTTPLQWVLHQRVGLAQRMLETSDLPVEFVAHRAGFGSATALRQHFGRVVGTNPVSYRHTFRRAS
jgi:AraC family transcriptional regulator, transcriptional activator FtrA